VLKKVKEKVKKIKSTLAGHGHGHGHDGEHGGDERMGEEDAYAGSDSSGEGEEDAVEREAALEKDGYMEDIEDKPVVMESDPDPDVHGTPSKCSSHLIAGVRRVCSKTCALTCLRDPFAVYESARAPAVQDIVAEYDQPAWTPAVREVEGDGVAPRVRLGDVGGPVVEDPAAPRSKTPAARGTYVWHTPSNATRSCLSGTL
jgi:hypothetical protein